MANIEMLLHLPHTRFLAEEEGFWDIYRELARETPTRGNMVPDAHLAAILRLHGVKRLYTRDRDFLKFSFLHRLLGPQARRLEDLDDAAEMIDLLHKVLLLWEKGRREEML